MSTKLTIIIPTKNRHELIKDFILELDGNLPLSIEYIIHDNSEQKLTVNINQTESIKYYHTCENLSVGENFSTALNYANGEYICFIGDDDVALHNTILELINKHNSRPDILISPIIDLIFHPGCNIKYLSHFQAKTLIRPDIFGKFIIKLIFHFSRLTSNFWIFWLLTPDLWVTPKGYFGIFKKSILDNAAQRQLIFLSPDTYLMGLLRNNKKIFYYNSPFFIPGTSSGSTSNLSNNGLHIGKISEQKHLKYTDLQKIPQDVPDLFYPEIIWAASYLAGQGVSKISHFHNNIIKSFIRLKYKKSYSIPKTKKILNDICLTIFGNITGLIFYIANRFLVSMLILARYRLSNQVVQFEPN